MATRIESLVYPGPLRELIPDGDEMELAAGRPRLEFRTALSQFDLAAVVAPRKMVDVSLAAACHAGLWLAHNFLDESHRISQDIDTPTGSFWHGIMHRREGDFENACYWFRRVGDHEVYPALYEAACNVAAEVKDDRLAHLAQQKRWDSAGFVEVVRSVVTGRARATTASACRRIARQEWELLFNYCYGGCQG